MGINHTCVSTEGYLSWMEFYECSSSTIWRWYSFNSSSDSKGTPALSTLFCPCAAEAGMALYSVQWVKNHQHTTVCPEAQEWGRASQNSGVSDGITNKETGCKRWTALPHAIREYFTYKEIALHHANRQGNALREDSISLSTLPLLLLWHSIGFIMCLVLESPECIPPVFCLFSLSPPPTLATYRRFRFLWFWKRGKTNK